MLTSISKDLQQRLKVAFSDVLYSGTGDNDPIYLTAACLDPLTAQAACVFDENPQVAAAAIKQMVRNLIS